MFFKNDLGYLNRTVESMRIGTMNNEETFEEIDEAIYVAGKLAGWENVVTIVRNDVYSWTVKILERKK